MFAWYFTSGSNPKARQHNAPPASCHAFDGFLLELQQCVADFHGVRRIGAIQFQQVSQEVNSGASYEQYFRFRPVGEIKTIKERLMNVGLSEVADLTQQAIDVAFPDGIPDNDSKKQTLTEWSEAQDQNLQKLGQRFTDFNGRITNVLAEYFRKNQRS